MQDAEQLCRRLGMQQFQQVFVANETKWLLFSLEKRGFKTRLAESQRGEKNSSIEVMFTQKTFNYGESRAAAFALVSSVKYMLRNDFASAVFFGHRFSTLQIIPH